MQGVTSRFLEAYNYLLSLKKVSDTKDFAGKIGVSNSLMTEIKKGRSNVGIKAIQNTVKKFPEIDTDWLITGRGVLQKTFKTEELSYNPKDTIAPNAIPLISIDTFADIEFNIKDPLISESSYIMPLFEGEGIDFLIPVRGADMYPKFSSGDIVACKMLEELPFVQWNKIYVVSTRNQGVIIKRLRNSEKENHIICRSENKDYEDFTITPNDILRVALVVGAITLE